MTGTVPPPPVPETRTQPQRRFTVALAVAAVSMALLAAGCRVDIVVDIDIAHDGAGEVTVEVVFDEEVLRWTPGLAELIVTDDLVGWEVSRQLSDTSAGERLVVVASKRFSSPSELAGVLAEIDQPPDGSAGLFRSATYVGSRDGALVRYELTVTVGLDRPISELVNPATAEALEGERFGMQIADIEARAGVPLDELVSLVVQASVPNGAGRLPESGAMTLNESDTRNEDGTRELRVVGEMVDHEIATADADAERLAQRASRGTRIAIVWGIAVAIIAALLLALAARNRRRRQGFSFR
ncbi:hypothetical protein [Candidatus Poriferisodalis sp.]|uniref:hypothetical protein n=1 Tax=Candidatus Poriferisodalis sp. TaxID=3101277 RepID=UPI003B014D7F